MTSQHDKLCPLYSAQHHREQHLSPQQRFEQTFMRGRTATTDPEDAQYLYARDQTLLYPQHIPISPLLRVSPQSLLNPMLYQDQSEPSVFVQPLQTYINQPGVSFNSESSTIEQSYQDTHGFSSSPPISRPSSFMPKYTGQHQYPRLFRSVIQPCFSPPFVDIRIQFPTPPLYIPPKPIPRQRKSTTENNPIVISEDESAPASEYDETQKPDEESNITDLVTFDYAEDKTEPTPEQQPVGSSMNEQLPESSSANTEQQIPVSRPPYSNSALIGMAIMSSPHKQLGVRDIYNAISSMFPYYDKSKRAWKNTMRHCLKTSKCFKQVEDGNKSLWTVDENSGENFMKGSFQKSKVPRRRPYVVQRPRPAQNKTISSGVPKDWSLDSIWLLYAKELQIKTIPNPDAHILELLPPDTPPDGSSECFKTYISR